MSTVYNKRELLMARLYLKVLLLASLFSGISLYSQNVKGVKPFYIKCGKTSVRIVAAKSWTPDIIKYNGQIMAQPNGFSGLVADFKGHNSFIGSGHTEGGKEKVVSFKLLIDGKVVAIPNNGEIIKCNRAETIKESYLDDLKLISKVIVTQDSVKEIHDIIAEKDIRIDRLYGFLHCWTNKSTEWIAKQRIGKIKQGKFVNSGDFHLLGDVRWAAEFIPEANAVIFTEFPSDLPAGEGRKHCYWDIKNYHKQYYQAMSKKQLKKGDKFHYEMTTKFLPASENNWKERAVAAGEDSKYEIQKLSYSSEFFFIDLKKVANMAFEDDQADNKKGGWTDQGPHNDLKGLSSGEKIFNDIPFEIINPVLNNNKSCVVLRNKYRPYFPLESKPITINRKAQVLCLLMTCAWSGEYNKNIASFIVRYKDSTFYSEIPVTYGKHVGGWWNPSPVSVGKVAWKASNSSADIGLYSFGWVNPYPNKEIKEIQLVSAAKGGLPILVAATGVSPSPLGGKLEKIIKQREFSAINKGAAPSKVNITVDFNQQLKHKPLYSVAFGIGGNCITPLYRKAAQNIIDAGSGKVLFRYQVSTGVGKAEPALAENIWDFKKLDRVVNYIKDIGAVPMLCFGPGGPIWMAKKDNIYGDSKRYWRPESIEEYSDYCRKIAQHYKDKNIPVMWEIGNEVELKRWPLSYYLKVYDKVSQKIKGVSSELKTGGPASCNPNLGWARGIMRQYPQSVDFITYHEYGYSETFDTPADFVMSKTEKYETSAQEYREIINKLLPGRDIPLLVTEANINWRWQGGTDPKIRNNAGAAWFASVQGRFWRGGGDALCYFTFGGGFGCCYKSGDDQLTLSPTYHAIWLYRKLAGNTMFKTSGSSETVESYAFLTDSGKNIIIVNKNNATVKASIQIASKANKAEIYRINKETCDAVKYLTLSAKVPQIKPQTASYSDKLQIVLKPFEVCGISIKQGK
jgi:hypothetical protein